MSKYRAIRTEVDGVTFPSKAEARRYSELRLMEEAGEIEDLRLQVRYPIRVNGRLVCTYVADAVYTETRTGRQVVEDTKGGRGTVTPVFKLKQKLMKAVLDIDVEVVYA